ncbi:cation diffusion facilitator family transporter [Novibacillus thermophilus]|uniref:Cation-efflux pump n=1 Tax=Novibacillus thermophilus TaxID=1471761 RepID=A0A1U9K3X0_9BACL|nr:cation diffusion facilitator family transporter [Novibacillus thermophilus]AQS54723.1 cation-efflux pump [Novibacillus thermophilus]
MRPARVASLSIISNTFVVLLKIVVGLLTGSVAILSEAIHSGLDLMASVIAYVSVRTSHQPPDRTHPYGHGKIENVSGTIETLLIFVAGIWIIVESAEKILHPEPIRMPFLGISVMLIGALVNWLVGRKIRRVGEETKSVAMKSNALHLMTDVYTSLGVAASLTLVSFTGFYFLDPLIAIGIALFIMKEAVQLGKESFMPLLDASLTGKEREQINRIIQHYADEYIEYHNLRTRRSGAEEHVDLHLVVPSDKSVDEAHNLCDRIEADIRRVFPKAQVLIHIEPESERKDK